MARTSARCSTQGFRFAAAMVVTAAVLLGNVACTYAWRVPTSAPAEPACPPIPDAGDLHLSADELARVDAGDIVLRMVQRGEHGGSAQAVGYLDATPAWLFEIATDSSLTDGMADIIRDVQLVESHPGGKTIHGVAHPSMFLPSFQYTILVSYLDDGTGQCWSQTQGDFAANQGSHAYLWDPVRGQTLAVFTFDIEFRGVLSVIPQPLVVHLTAHTLPSYMRSLESAAKRLAVEDTARAARVEERWRALRARLETRQLAGRVWTGPVVGRVGLDRHDATFTAARLEHGAAPGDGAQ